MDKFDELLKNFDLEFFGSGRHKISVEKALELHRDNKAVIVDVRTKEEVSHVRFDFALNIPVSHIPDRLAEILEDKTVIVFCSSVVRAAIVYTYLRLKGYSDVKILTVGLSEIAGCLKPGYVLKTTGKSL
ncbi:MAG: rhodanese-like domain-containing protein [Candidatus Makaraimicrobium thalassicum]|nr:MAG: rhodanese-like domain-containing protein [Candidatus Omnitrophota bacterium]